MQTRTTNSGLFTLRYIFHYCTIDPLHPTIRYFVLHSVVGQNDCWMSEQTKKERLWNYIKSPFAEKLPHPILRWLHQAEDLFCLLLANVRWTAWKAGYRSWQRRRRPRMALGGSWCRYPCTRWTLQIPLWWVARWWTAWSAEGSSLIPR